MKLSKDQKYALAKDIGKEREKKDKAKFAKIKKDPDIIKKAKEEFLIIEKARRILNTSSVLGKYERIKSIGLDECATRIVSKKFSFRSHYVQNIVEEIDLASIEAETLKELREKLL